MMEFNLVRAFSVAMCVIGSLLILSSSKILTKRSRYERVAEYLAPTSTLAKDPFTQLTSYLKVFLGPIIDKFSRTDSMSSLIPIFSKVVGEIDLKYAFPPLMAFISVAIVTGSATFAIVAGILAPLVILIFKSSRIYQGERRRIRELNDALPLYIEQIGSFVASGLSIQSAIDRYPKTVKSPWSTLSKEMSAEIRRGANPGSALGLVALQYRLGGLDHLIRLLEANYSTPELPSLLDEQSRSFRRRQQLELTEKLAKRAQAVWIPVSVAALVPGIIFVMIPFISALHAFGGI